MNKDFTFKKVMIIVLAILNIGVIGLLGSYIVPAFRAHEVEIAHQNDVNKDDGKEVLRDSQFSFIGVGDHLIYPSVYSKQEKPYNFDSIYENTNVYTQKADLAYVNAASLTLGEAYNMQDYSLFNGPAELMSSLDKAGFDWVSLSSEHVLDYGAKGLQDQLKLMNDNFTNMSVTGAHQQKDEALMVREVNGIRVGLASYTYDAPFKDDEAWMVDVIDMDAMQKDIEALNAVSDVQFVSLHWGTEFDPNVEDSQKEIVKKLNEWGVEVILGTHPHVLQPVEMFHGDSQDTLVYYSLGNFMSVQNHPSLVLGGMASFDLKYNFESKTSSFENVKLIPTFSYASKDLKTFSTNTILDVTKEMEENQWQETISGRACTKEYMDDFIKKVMKNYEDENIEVVYSE